MQFKAQCVPKKGSNGRKFVEPLLKLEKGTIVAAFFTGISVEIIDKQNIIAINEYSTFGKGSKSRGMPQIYAADFVDENETLVLCLEEAFFLGYVLNVIKIYNMQNEAMSWSDFLVAALQIDLNFIERAAVYLYLKARCWVIKSGIKFGGDYLIYRKGPNFYHASFLVLISTNKNPVSFNSKDIKGLQRIAETSNKDVLLLELEIPSDFTLNTLKDFKQIHLTETIMRRFNYTSFVQNPIKI